MTTPVTLSLAAVLADTAARRPDHPAVVFGETSISYRELWSRARRFAAALAEQGLGAGDMVALLLPNTPDFPAVYFGALALGAIVVPVHALLKAEEIGHVLRDSGARALVCAPSLRAEGAAAARAVGTPLLDLSELAALADRTEPVAGLAPRRPDDVAVVLYTSGTTGHPKGALLTHLGLTLNVTTTMLAPFDFSAEDVLLGCLPLFHTFGQICGMCVCFQAGGTLVLQERFEARQTLDLMVEHGCTVFMGVPTMYHALLDAAADDPRRPPLDRAFSGGSSLPPSVLDRFESTFGCTVYEGYGLTETSPVVAYNQRAWPTRPGTVGRPIRGVDAEIARADLEGRIELLPAGESGEIVVRGHNLMAGYLNRPEATAEVMVDGWFRSGDLGVKDADGYLSIIGRKKDVVLRGGYNVYPREVEELLLRHPVVAQVAVVGVPHPTHGEEVCAVVVLRPDADPDPGLAAELTAWSRQRLAAYKYPRLVEFVDELPLGPSGKVLKWKLVEGPGRPAASDTAGCAGSRSPARPDAGNIGSNEHEEP